MCCLHWRTCKNDVKCTRRKENECAYGHIFLALKTSMSISSDSENIFDIIYLVLPKSKIVYVLPALEDL
jgi:hypothetical protein